jgi:hypothetical protein
MSVVCPMCGSEDTMPFADVVLNSHGYHCQHCDKDFGVDKDNIISKNEEYLEEFSYEKRLKDSIRIVKIHKYSPQDIKLSLSVIKNKMLQPYEDIDFKDMFEPFVRMLFEKAFILDWPDNISEKEEEFNFSYKIELNYSFNRCKKVIKTGLNKEAIYLKVLDSLFDFFFQEQA